MEPLLEAREQRKYAREIVIKPGGVGDRGAHLQIFQHRHAHEDAAAFRRLRDLQPRDFVRSKRGDVAAGEGDRAIARARIAADRHHQRRFAGTVGADQRHDLAVADLDVDAAQRGDGAVIGGDAAHGEQWGAHSPTSACTSSTSSSGTPR